MCFDKKARKEQQGSRESPCSLLLFQGGWSGILTRDLTVNPKPRSSYLRSYEVGSFARSAHGRKHGHQDARQHQLRENQCSIQEELSGPGFEDTRNALVYGGKGTSKYQNHQTIFLPGTRPCRIRYGMPFEQLDPLSDMRPGVFVVCSLDLLKLRARAFDASKGCMHGYLIDCLYLETPRSEASACSSE